MYRKLIPYLAKYKGKIIGSSLCSVFEAIFELLIPLVLAKLLDDGIGSGRISYALQLGGEMLFLAILVFLCGILSVRLATRAGTGFSADLRQAQFSHIQRFSFRNIEHFGATSLITRLTSDVTAVQSAVFQCVKQVVRSSSMVLVAAVLSTRLCGRLSVMFLILVPIMAVILVLIVLRSRPLYQDLQESVDSLNLVTQENLTGVRTVRAYVRSAFSLERFQNVNNAVFYAADRAFGTTALGTPVVTLFTNISMLVLLGYGGYMVIAGAATVGQLTGFITYISQIFAQLMSLANAILLLNRSMVSAQRIGEVLDQQPELQDGSYSGIVPDGSIEFRQVSFSYGNTPPVLSDVTLSIASGQTVGIVGGTGSAKSTLTQLIPRLYEVSSGQILVGGRDVRDYKLETLRRSAAMVLQVNTLFSGTIRENLLWGDPDATEKQLDDACDIACASEFIRSFPQGYDTKLGQGGVNLSGGQKQRLCLARAILQQPKILILDDSTSAVDMQTDQHIREAIAAHRPDMTKLIIAQRIRSVSYADFILVLDEGKISAMGTHEELLERSEIYRQMYLSQEEGRQQHEA
jgi:ATP-binding cassette subfamily B protein